MVGFILDGWRRCCRGRNRMGDIMNVHTVVIHYSATYPDADITRATIDKWHRDRGFREIGYHWFIRRDGTLEEGRPEGTLGAHVRGHNSGTIGICWAGGLDRETGPDVGRWNPTQAQIDCMVRLIHDIQGRWPKARRVVGHKDLAATECPGLPRGGVARWWAEQARSAPSAPAPSINPLAALLAALSAVAAFFTRRK